MAERPMPWYLLGAIAVGAWVTAAVLTLLGGVFVFGLLELEDAIAASVLGIGYFLFGLAMLRDENGGVFREQIGIATAAAGIALIAGGIAGQFDETWAGFAVAAGLTAVVVRFCNDRTLQFLAAALTLAFLVFALLEHRTPYFLGVIALATPAGLALLLYPPRRDLAPTAIALLLLFPLVSVVAMDSGYWMRRIQPGGDFARILHLLLFLAFVYLHWSRDANETAKWRTLAFAVVATAVCLLLPPGGSAAMLLMMLAFVIGSLPFAALGAALEVQFLVRYYYSLEATLLTKSLLLSAVGLLLLAAWWPMRRAGRARAGE